MPHLEVPSLMVELINATIIIPLVPYSQRRINLSQNIKLNFTKNGLANLWIEIDIHQN